MNNFTYSVPTKIHFGKGQISHLSELSESGNKVLLCYGGGSIKKAGIYDEAVKILKEEDMDVIAECIALVLQSEDNIEKVKGMVAELTAKYPLDM